MNNENKEMCAKCKGQCCKNMPGQYIPEDLFDHEMTKDELKQFILDRKNIAIDCWDGDKDSDYKDYYYLRPMRKIRSEEEYMKSNFLSKDMIDVYKRLYKQYKNDFNPIVDYAWTQPAMFICIHLTENGCDLSYDDRPTCCKELTPDLENGCYNEHCDAEHSKLYYAKKWSKYNKLLKEIANEIIMEEYNK